MSSLYVNPFTDFGFKKLFGEEASKPMLIDFLNSLLTENNEIVDLTFKENEQLGRIEADRKAVYDFYCENENGEKFIVELQKAKQQYFKDRTIYYSTFPIQEQAQKGEWNFQLKAVYCIGILDFEFNDYLNDPSKGEVLHTVQLKDQNNKHFYEKLKYVYLEMPNFNKKENELVTRLDKWLYFIKNLEDFHQIPDIFKDKIFIQAFETAEIAKYNRQELESYQQSLKVFRDNNATFDYAQKTSYRKGHLDGLSAGLSEGLLTGKLEVALNAKKMGISVEDISKLTGLTKEEIEKL